MAARLITGPKGLGMNTTCPEGAAVEAALRFSRVRHTLHSHEKQVVSNQKSTNGTDVVAGTTLADDIEAAFADATRDPHWPHVTSADPLPPVLLLPGSSVNSSTATPRTPRVSAVSPRGRATSPSGNAAATSKWTYRLGTASIIDTAVQSDSEVRGSSSSLSLASVDSTQAVLGESLVSLVRTTLFPAFEWFVYSDPEHFAAVASGMSAMQTPCSRVGPDGKTFVSRAQQLMTNFVGGVHRNPNAVRTSRLAGLRQLPMGISTADDAMSAAHRGLSVLEALLSDQRVADAPANKNGSADGSTGSTRPAGLPPLAIPRQSPTQTDGVGPVKYVLGTAHPTVVDAFVFAGIKLLCTAQFRPGSAGAEFVSEHGLRLSAPAMYSAEEGGAPDPFLSSDSGVQCAFPHVMRYASEIAACFYQRELEAYAAYAENRTGKVVTPSSSSWSSTLFSNMFKRFTRSGGSTSGTSGGGDSSAHTAGATTQMVDEEDSRVYGGWGRGLTIAGTVLFGASYLVVSNAETILALIGLFTDIEDELNELQEQVEQEERAGEQQREE